MARIAMAVYDTEENGRSEMTKETMSCLLQRVNLNRHRLFFINNASCKKTDLLLKSYSTYEGITVLHNPVNIGTAEAINQAWRFREPGENAIKMDNDVVIHSSGWVDELEEAIRREPTIGICGLKRKDCWENPAHENDFYRSELMMLPHKPGERWMVAEKVSHVMGTCQMYSSALLDKIGYLYQPKLYGFDDSFASFRSNMAGFINVFLPHIHIDHIDPGGTDYQKWKEQHAGECWKEYHETLRDYKNGTKSIYYNPFK